MRWMRSFDQFLEKSNITNITYYLIGGQVLCFILTMLIPSLQTTLELNAVPLLQGQWWRALTFLFIPLSYSPLWAALGWYMTYLFGTALEQVWGAGRYLLYLTVAYSGTLLSAFLFPGVSIGNAHIYTSIFLAAAYLFPDFQLLLFFIIPVKLKWLGLLTGLGIVLSILTGDFQTKVLSLISVTNFLFFFGPSIVGGIRTKGNLIPKSSQKTASYMRCSICGKTEHDNKIFYYCHTCKPEKQYCEDHINTHTHKK